MCHHVTAFFVLTDELSLAPSFEVIFGHSLLVTGFGSLSLGHCLCVINSLPLFFDFYLSSVAPSFEIVSGHCLCVTVLGLFLACLFVFGLDFVFGS